MLHCPYCGTSVNEDEQYCIKCGKQLPNDMHHRLINKKQFNTYWYIPLIIAAVFLVSSGIYYFMLQSNTTHAKESYVQGEQAALDADYNKASKLFTKALDKKDNFVQAETSLAFAERALEVESLLTKTDDLLKKKDYSQALSIIKEAESNLNSFNGDAVAMLIDQIMFKRNTIKIAKLKESLKKDPGIDELKILIWEADAINDNEAEDMTKDIRNEIIEYFFSKATEQLNTKQFTDAQTLIEDGLKYAPESEKLRSLQTTIDKEKTAFESEQQQRIEQAMDTAAKDQKFNEDEAIELVSANIKSDKNGKLVVKGEVKSDATIPINSILIEYTIYNKKKSEILTNEVFVYPDKLYPKESGEFKFTHLDKEEKAKNLTIEVNKITWYTD
ncbi:zinc-ribbon domain-containing protein [Virgibacillus halotolerans]|uniref:zinc-ribbon domain-containing protein n=1 Tax=Virgibacillus halotolerans TaxID=1071053 RepID=UPI00195F8352|nr:zinc-ribbon domain-containing protein [Virgibacillus halotolerans]